MSNLKFTLSEDNLSRLIKNYIQACLLHYVAIRVFTLLTYANLLTV